MGVNPSTPVTMFEHGASHTGSIMGCGVDHAHVHLVPLDFNLAEEAVSELGRVVILGA